MKKKSRGERPSYYSITKISKKMQIDFSEGGD
jgi:hypothetical protein